MSANFRVELEETNGNLHLMARGDFDGSSACELVNLLTERYDGRGRIVIDTHSLRNICPFGSSTFLCRLTDCRIPADRLYFKGEKGRQIAPQGSTVIVDPESGKHRCCGNCVNCPCRKHGKK